MKGVNFGNLIKDIEDLKFQDDEILKKLKSCFYEHGLEKKAVYVFWTFEAIKKAKRYEVLVDVLEKISLQLAAHNSFSDVFQCYLDAHSDEVDSDLDYRMLQVMKKYEYQDGIDKFAATKRGITPPVVEQPINTVAASEMMSNFIGASWKGQSVIPDSHADSILSSSLEPIAVTPSTKGKLPFCSRIRKGHKKVKENGLRRAAIDDQCDLEGLISKSHLSNEHADVLRNEIEISPDCLRSFMLRKKHSNNKVASCSYDDSVVMVSL